MIKNITDQTFQDVIQKPGLVLVDFWAPWCGPCRILGPILEELDQQFEDMVTIAKVNVDENPTVSSQFSVMSIPTLKLFKNGEEMTTLVGVQPLETLQKAIQNLR